MIGCLTETTTCVVAKPLSELLKYVDLNWAKVLKWFRMKRTNGTTKMREENKELYGRIDRGKETSYSLNGVLRQRPKLDGGLSI